VDETQWYTSLPGNYTYTIDAPIACVDAVAVVTVSVNEQPNAGNNDSVTRCSTDSPVNLFNELGGSPDLGGSWTGPDGPASSTFIPGTSTPGVYTYSLSGAAPCVDDQATLNVTINQAPDAGEDGDLTICEDGPSVDLFAGLGGTYDLGGTWADEDNTNQLSGNIFDPFGLAPGTYSFEYTVPANGNCSADDAHVDVTIVAALDAGSNSSPTVCGNNTQVNLFNLIGGNPQAGGTWLDLDNTLAVAGNNFNASLVPAPGVYNFRYRLAGSAGCAPDSALVTLSVVAPPNVGNGPVTVTVCSNAAPFSMFNLIGGNPAPGGNWFVGSPFGAPHGANYVPANDNPNDFYYVLGGTAPCASANTRVTVNEVPEANAGNNGVTTVCSIGPAFNMTSLLTGNPSPNGTWFFSNQNHGVLFVPGIDVQGVYEYRVPGTAPCNTDIATLTISVVNGANAGCNSSVTVCDGDAPFLLFNILTCDPQNGGFWLGPDMLSHNGTYIPGASTPGDYRYIITGSSPCINDTSIVSVFENADPDPGTTGSGSFCGSASEPGTPLDLFTLLGGTPDPFGTWVGPAPTNPPFTQPFIPGVSSPGAYTYTVTNTCGSESAQVTVTVNAPPNPGCNNTIARCSSSSPFDMTAQLGCSPQFGGQWSGPLPLTTNVSAIFTPGTTPPGTYRYTVNGSGACDPRSALLTITVSPEANAGCGTSLSVCTTDAQINLPSLLGCGAQAGGTWWLNGITPHSSTFNPAVDVSGSYVYRVTGVPPCTNDEASVVIQVYTAPNAGGAGLAETCSDDNPFALINFITGGPQLNGNWTDPSGSAHSGIYDPDLNGPGLYKYRIPGNPGCDADSVYVTVFEYNAVDAGGNGDTLVCSDGVPFSLFALLGGTPQTGGDWYTPNGTAFPGDIYTPGVSVPGPYKYKLIGTAPCESDSATVTVFQSTAPNAGISRLVAACSLDAPFTLIDSLGGTPDGNGVWTYYGDEYGSIFNPDTAQPGPYVYTVVGAAPCGSATAQVVVTVTLAADPGLNGTLSACVNADAIELFDGLLGFPTSGGLWSTTCGQGVLSNGVFDATGMVEGASCTFTYIHPANGPCPASNSSVVLNIVDALDAGENSSAQICRGDCVDLFTTLSGTPQTGGYWLNLDGAPGVTGSSFCTAAAPAGSVWTFDHILPGSAQCESDTARVTIEVLDGPFAGGDGGITVCSNSAPINMGTALSGGPDAGGQWFDPSWVAHGANYVPATDAPGQYHYVVGAAGACPADTANVNMSEDQAVDAGNNATLNICSTDDPVSMFTLLGPNAQTGGSWICIPCGGTTHSGAYNPAVDIPGQYQYTINASPPCSNDFAIVTVTEPQAPNAGCNDEVTVCSDDDNFNMRTQLGCTPASGGTWVYVTGGDVPHSEFFDPGVDLPGIYRYTITGTAPCQDSSALLTVNVVDAGNPGASATVNACLSQTEVDLFDALGGNPQTGGTWTDLDNSQALTDSLFNPSLAGNGTWDFSYTILGSGPCPTVSSIITVVVGAGGNAGLDSTAVVCGNETAFDLFTGLGGDPTPGGTWADINGTGASLVNGILDVSDLPIGGSSPFVYTIDDPGCGEVSAVVLVTATAFPVAGTGTSLTLCSTTSSTDLFTQLGGSPDAGGTWTDPQNAVHSNIFDPASDAEGDYTYTVTGTSPCPNATATIAITVNDPPSAGSNGEMLSCDTVQALDLFSGLQGLPQPGGTWEDLNASGGLTGGSLNTTDLSPSEYNYRYTVSAAGCGSASAVVTVLVVTSVEVIDVVRVCNESDRTYTVTFTIEQGDAPTYAVTGLNGTISSTEPFIFTSVPIFTSDAFEAFVSDQYGCAVVRVADVSPCVFDDEVFIPESFSPNGDGTNEQFLIPGIEGYPSNSISIFNRWGAKLYEATGYDNTNVVWDGTTDNGVAPAGTYFYVLELGNGSDAFTGYIYLNR
jgi:gliding motility-associated-like protein